MNSLNNKIKMVGGLILVLSIVLFISLSTITIKKGAEYADESESKRLKTIQVSGQRGEITDRNGVVLATNKKSFSVKFARDVSKTKASDRALYTQSLIKAIAAIEENGGKVISSFNIKQNENNEFYFDFNTESEETHNSRLKQWKENFYFSNNDYTPEQMYTKLRSRYNIPETTDTSMAMKILSIWQEVQMNAFRSYFDIVFASNIDVATISELETLSFYDDCIQIIENYTRVYPKGNTAAHVLGYTGKQTNEDQIKENESLGYSQTDEVGISGIELSQERILTGSTSDNKGSKVVEVNNIGKVIREISNTPATSGDTVMLTIDYELQKKTEEALTENIRIVREEQEALYANNKAVYDQKVADRGGSEIKMADQGAAVVMDVKSGEILSMVSYPDYDPNIFIGGIDEKTYSALSQNTSAPLYNKAISGGTPGSIFKMVTAVAGLMEGDVTVGETINDQGMYTRHLNNANAIGPKCWTSVPSNHSAQNVSKAIQNSCNYYFYEISYRMGNEKIVKWATQLGITNKTNIELAGEVTGKVGDQSVLYDNQYQSSEQKTGMAVLVKRQIEGYINGYLETLNITHDANSVSAAAESLLKLVDGNTTEYGAQIRKILNEQLDIPVATSNTRRWDTEISASLTQLRWTANDTIVTGIGQGITTVTPVAVARYISALVNGGSVFDAKLVKSTVTADGVSTDKKSKLYNTTDINDNYIEAIKKGMQNVVSHDDGSSVITYFKSWSEERRKMLAGKTGTGQVSQIDIENNAWFAAFAPYDDPEIAVVVFLPNGYAGSRASYTVAQVVELYLDRKEQENQQSLSKDSEIKNYQ